MKRKLIILLLFAVLTAKAQEKEHFGLVTDRELYSSGETLLLKVFAPETEQSGIVNIDLINIKGRVISRISKKIVNHQADGFIDLPDSLSTGCYLLCAATKSNSILTIKELYICNQFTELPESNLTFRSSETNIFVKKPSASFLIDGLDPTYKTRGKANLTLRLPAEFLSQITDNLFVSVAEISPGFEAKTFLKNVTPKTNHNIEKEGVIIEGSVHDIKTGAPFRNGIVFLSIPDTIPGLKCFITGEDGNFNFHLDNYFGKIPVVIQGFDPEEKRLLKINLKKYDFFEGGLPSVEPMTISRELRSTVRENNEAATLRKIFNSQELAIAPVSTNKADDYPFYGIPTHIIDPQLFIDLPNFTEIARELLPEVKFRTHNRIPSLQVFSPALHNYFSDPPLLLIDGIPNRDLNVIKEMDSKEIDRIEICNNKRFYGSLEFNGVVAIYTLKNDYSRIKESDELIRLTLDGIQPDVSLKPLSSRPSTEMDLRKVLLWKPSLKPEEIIRLDFETSDIKGKYRLTIHGKNRDGSMFYKEQLFEVN